MTSRNLNDAHDILRLQYLTAKEIFEKKYKNAEVFITCTYRSIDEQDELYKQGRSKKVFG